jgi:parvulin-like peptidyl-prolyl isomerase
MVQLTFAALSLLALLSGYAAERTTPPAPVAAPKPDSVLATLGGSTIGESDFQRFVEESYQPQQVVEVRQNPAARQAALEAYLDLQVMAAKARKDGLAMLPDFQKARELAEMKLLASLLNERERQRAGQDPQVTDEEISNYYDQHTNWFQIRPGFSARQILIYVKGNPAFPDKGLPDADAKTKADLARAKLRSGERWEQVARVYSDDLETKEHGGLIRNGVFGYYPTEMETALRRQEPGQLGDPVKSQFGYHVLQLERRSSEGERQPLADVRDIITSRILADKQAAARQAYLEPLRAELGLKKTALAGTNVSLLDSSAIPPDAILATLGGVPLREADFQWFLKDAFRAEQRQSAFSRPEARSQLLASFLDLRVLEAKARKEGLDKGSRYQGACALMDMKLLAEFLQERDGTTPWKLPGATEEARSDAFRSYLGQLRTEMGLKERPALPAGAE